MSKYIWILDPGHGGINPDTGKYVTPGKRSPKWKDGTQYFEGEGNRCIVNTILKKCRENNIIALDVVNDWQDISLATRVNRANTVNSYHGNCIYISVHSNGFSQESANGYSVYTSRGNTKSDQYAEILLKYMQLEFPESKLRQDTSDSDRDKEADFYVLSRTSMPAILSENFFMTNKAECDMLLKKSVRDRIADCHFKLIKQIENG